MSTFLVVDDHPSFRREARALLESGGHRVVGEAADGASAIAAAAELTPDAVLLDICLPGLDGIDVAVRLTALGSSPAIILTSTRPASDYGSRLAACRAVGFLGKEELTLSAIESLLPGAAR